MKKILIFDHEQDNLKLAELSLKNHYHVLTAADAEQVMEYVKSEKPDLVLLEVIVDGFNIFQQIKNHDRNIKVGFLTVAGQKEYVEKGKALGAEIYIVKPYDPFEIVERIKRAF